jgi:hypothetical protein
VLAQELGECRVRARTGQAVDRLGIEARERQQPLDCRKPRLFGTVIGRLGDLHGLAVLALARQHLAEGNKALLVVLAAPRAGNQKIAVADAKH